MKCIHCNSEWKTDEKIASSLTSCPFCGKSLVGKEEPPKIGDIIPFGKYKWLVLDVQDGEVLIITEGTIEERPYNKEYEGVTWENCTLRSYLSGAFYNTFSEEDKKRIIEKRISNPDNLWYGTKGGRDTRDKVFLLSLEEVDKYFGDSGDYLNKRRKSREGCTDEKFIADNDGCFLSNNHDRDRAAENGRGGADMWWLRSPGYCGSYAAVVFYYGSVEVQGGNVEDRDDDRFVVGRVAVRPALWLRV